MSEADRSEARRVRAIAIIGLSTTGAAIGRALCRVEGDYEVRGHDRDPERARDAVRSKAIDTAKWNLIDAVAQADMIIVSEPAMQAVDTLLTLAPHVSAGTIVTGAFSPMAPAMDVASRALPQGVDYIAGHPILTPGASIGADDGPPLNGAQYCLAPLPTTGEKAVRVMADLVAAIGAQPYYIDASEHDALIAAVQHVPFLFDSVLTGLLGESPSVRDLRRLSPSTSPGAGRGTPADVEAAAEALAADPGAAVVWLDQVIAGLSDWREVLAAADADELQTMLAQSAASRSHWSGAAEPTVGDEVRQALDEVNPLRDMLLGRGFRRGRGGEQG